MPEMKVSSIAILLVVVVVITVPILIFAGVIGGFWIFTKENMDKTIAGAKGYTAAKTPGDAMDKFRDAIKNRDYDSASYFTTKPYSEMLKKSHTNAKALGGVVDKIRDWGHNKGLLTDKLKITLFRIDPFPKNFKPGPTPKQEGDKKAQGSYQWDPAFTLDNMAVMAQMENDLKSLDLRMFNNVLFTGAQAITGITTVPLVKDGEEWKLDIPMTPAWEGEIVYFNDRCKSYQTALDGLWSDMNRERSYDTKGAFEGAVMEKLRGAK